MFIPTYTLPYTEKQNTEEHIMWKLTYIKRSLKMWASNTAWNKHCILDNFKWEK